VFLTSSAASAAFGTADFAVVGLDIEATDFEECSSINAIIS